VGSGNSTDGSSGKSGGGQTVNTIVVVVVVLLLLAVIVAVVVVATRHRGNESDAGAGSGAVGADDSMNPSWADAGHSTFEHANPVYVEPSSTAGGAALYDFSDVTANYNEQPWGGREEYIEVSGAGGGDATGHVGVSSAGDSKLEKKAARILTKKLERTPTPAEIAKKVKQLKKKAAMAAV
jgi:hypothetical protein